MCRAPTALIPRQPAVNEAKGSCDKMARLAAIGAIVLLMRRHGQRACATKMREKILHQRSRSCICKPHRAGSRQETTHVKWKEHHGICFFLHCMHKTWLCKNHLDHLGNALVRKLKKGTETYIFLAIDPSGEGAVSIPGGQGSKICALSLELNRLKSFCQDTRLGRSVTWVRGQSFMC